MKLQLSCDLISIDRAVKLAEDILPFIDIIEMGTPFLLQNGINAVKTFKERFPAKLILADMKIMDSGYEEAKMAFEARADIVTVLAVSSPNTIRNAIVCAKEFGKKVMADMIEVKNIIERAKFLQDLGIDYICVHTAVDNQKSENPLADLYTLKQSIENARLAVAGGIKLENIDAVICEKPDIVIVGGGLTKAPNPREIARAMKEKMENISRIGKDDEICGV